MWFGCDRVFFSEEQAQNNSSSRLMACIIAGQRVSVNEFILLLSDLSHYSAFDDTATCCVGCILLPHSIQQTPCNDARFRQIDIIGAVVIVWRVRGKIIRSVLCNTVCNNCAHCSAHTYEQT